MYQWKRYYLQYFNQLSDVQADIFRAQEIFDEFYLKNILHKIIFRLGYKKIYRKINIALKEKIDSYNPDIIFVFKGMEIYPGTLKWIKRKDIKVVNYNPDNPFIFSGKGSGNINITRSVSFYDLHFTYNLDTKKIIEDKYNIPVYWLPFGFDVSTQLYEKASSLNEIIKVCFVGNPDKHRALFLKLLAEKGISIDIYGSRWNNFISHPNITLYPPVYDHELWLTLRKYRVQLNPLRIHNVNSHGMRSFEVPAIGGIMLAPRTKEHLQFFDEDKEAFYYKDYNEAVVKINHLLSLQQVEANKIRDAARTRSINNKYDYKSRSEFVIEVLRDMNNEKNI